jgi:sugar lactone lactonase YvrE
MLSLHRFLLIFLAISPLAACAHRAERSTLETKYDIQDFTSDGSFETNILHQFTSPSWVENLAVCDNGDILVTMISPSASLYRIANPQSSNPTTTLVHTFLNVESLLGIAELRPDFFVVVGTNASGVVAIPGTGFLWSVDFSASSSSPLITEITALPQVSYPNGMTALPENDGAVLLADSTLGCVWRIDIHTKAVDIAVQLPQMEPPSTASTPIGINGVHAKQDPFGSTVLYWSNSFETTIYSINIDGCTGVMLSGQQEPRIRARAEDGYLFVDDFAIDSQGGIWAAANFNNTVLYASTQSHILRPVVGSENSLLMAGCTSCSFGRRPGMDNVLYVTNSGAEVFPVNGTLTMGANVVAVNVSSI